MNINKIVGFSAAGVLALGTIIPIVSFPIVGSFNLWKNGTGDGVWVFLTAIAAAALIFFNLQKFALIPGAIALVIIVANTIQMNDALNQMNSQLAGTMFAGLSGTVQVQAGWFFLYLGAVAILVSPFSNQIKQLLVSKTAKVSPESAEAAE